ncbi:glycine/D-amino acid oxidase-like deaminating enzyme [Pseudomonas sp. GV105]|uniref:FAD-dependent oxidoreductase n=1 Tax=Pseudomonas sp. GV105 TaxID=2135759 RepID=UPI000D375246|nr:FAD-dependent oxidoreductase [Pseudomonas sp. GV105]PUB37686.1 glycine/D-amino acid oxidase-like deaminating enzyme [Pseudomonas sp. GV105]
MPYENAQKAVAVFGDGIEALLNGYYLQRFGFKADIYLSQPSSAAQIVPELISSWLCQYRDPVSRRLALQGIAELRDISIDLGAQLLASTEGSIVFECRKTHVSKLEQFAEGCSRTGILVKRASTSGSVSLPIGSLAAFSFPQDVSLYPRTFYKLLMDALMRRGASIYSGRGLNQLQMDDHVYRITYGGSTRRYDLAVQAREPASCNSETEASAGVAELKPALVGRYASFERLWDHISDDSSCTPAEPKSRILSTIRRALTGTSQNGTYMDEDIDLTYLNFQRVPGHENAYFTSRSDGIAQCVANARLLAESLYAGQDAIASERQSRMVVT